MQNADGRGAPGLNGDQLGPSLDAPTLVALQTTPPENPHIWEEPRFKDVQIRRITHWGITPQTGIPLAAPGKYQVRFTVDGTALHAAVRGDEGSGGRVVGRGPADCRRRRRSGFATTSRRPPRWSTRWRVWRKQIEDQVKANAAKPAIVKALTDLNKTILDVELKLVSRSEMLSDDKYFPEAYKVYMNLIWLSGGVGQGASDEAGSIDYKPTDTQMQVLDGRSRQELAAAKAGFEKLLSTDIPAFNKAMAGRCRRSEIREPRRRSGPWSRRTPSATLQR